MMLLPITLISYKGKILTALWNIWSSFWYCCCIIEHIFLLTTQRLFYIIIGFLCDTFMSLSWFIEKNVTVEFFIYFIFLPVSIIPSIIINHAGRYTLPYSKCGKKNKSSGRRGLHLARYPVSLRNQSTIIRPHIVTPFKGGRRFSHQARSPKTQKSPNPNPTSPPQRSFSASDQVNALLANDPSLSLDLFLFESKLYWDSFPQESLITPTFSSASVDSFLHSFNVI
jgi:hypothetical protein